MKLNLTFLILILGSSCHHDVQNTNPNEKAGEISEIMDSNENARTNDEYTGDSSLCYQYRTLVLQYSETLDTLTYNPLKTNRIKSELMIQRSIKDCEFGDEYYRSWEFIIENGVKIQFIEDSYNTKKHLLTLVDNDLYSVKKLFGEMFGRKSEIYFHYENGKMYLLTNGNFLYVEQPASWCGLANQFDFYQYFDLKKKELIQFVEKDTFIEKFK